MKTAVSFVKRGGLLAASIGCVVCLALSGTASAQVYKWVDETGKVHYGDAPPDRDDSKKKSVKINTPAPTPADREAALKRAEQERRTLNHMTETRKRTEDTLRRQKPATVSTATSPPPVSETPCQKEWREFREKSACFAPYRTATGGIKAEAYERCKEVTAPTSVCPP